MPGQGHRVDPVAEDRDELTGPQRRERPVEREADVWMLADAARRPVGRTAGLRSSVDGDATRPRATQHDRAAQGGDGCQGRRRRSAARRAIRAPRRRPSGDADDTGEQEERQSGAQEEVADRDDVLDDRDRDRDDVAERAQAQQEGSVQAGGRITWMADGTSAAVKPAAARLGS